jgi:hypothetical protein
VVALADGEVGGPPSAAVDADGPPGFAECYAASVPALVTQLYVYTGDLELAHDLVQEAFCRALTRWSRLAEYDDPAAWAQIAEQEAPAGCSTTGNTFACRFPSLAVGATRTVTADVVSASQPAGFVSVVASDADGYPDRTPDDNGAGCA